MGNVSSKGPVVISGGPTSNIGLGLALGSLITKMSIDGNEDRRIVEGFYARSIKQTSRSKVLLLCLWLLAATYYSRNAYYSIARRSSVFPQRVSSDIASFVVFAVNSYISFKHISPLELDIGRQFDASSLRKWADPVLDQNRARLHRLHRISSLLIVLLLILQKRSFVFQ